MKFAYTGRHIEVTPALREFTEEKLSKLERLLDGPLDAHVVLGIEKHRHSAEIQVRSRSAVLTSSQVSGDLYISIGEVADKLERQALKHKEKLHDHKHRKSPRDPEVAAAIGASAGLDVEAGPAESEAGGGVERVTEVHGKPMTVEEAAMEMEAGDHDVLLFRDARHERISVICRRRNGDLVLVEPEA